MDLSEIYRFEINKLFEEWKSKAPIGEIDHKNNVFISDGIVCPEQWFSQKVRPLFLLKEAYHGEGNWDLISEHLLTDKRIGSGTWRRVSEWTYGIMATTANKIPPYPVDETINYYGNPYLRKIAVVNIKKSGGTSSSNMETIGKYAEYDRVQLHKEIELIDPTVIFCGYTISLLNVIMEKTVKDYSHPNPNLFYFVKLNDHNVIVLDYYHPSNRYPAVINYYALMGIYQQALIQEKE